MKEMQLLSTRQAAKISGFTPRTIARWCREEKITAIKLGRVWRIPALLFHDWLYRADQ